MTLLAQVARHTPIPTPVHGVAPHPKDDVILATDVSARAEYLATGDSQLLHLGTSQGVTSRAPRGVLAVVSP